MAKILLLRHGEAKKIGEDTILTEKGNNEAKALAKKLQEITINKIYVSDLTRAQETMQHYLNGIKEKPEVVTTEKLREIYRVLVGGPERVGTPKDRKEKDKQRADEIYEKLLKEKGNIAVFAHGNIIRYLLIKAMDIQFTDLWNRLFLNTGSISVIEKTKEGLVRVNAINLIEHLPEAKEFFEEEIGTTYHP